MQKYSIAIPIPAGNADALVALSAEALGPRLAEHTASRQRVEITDERIWVQHTPSGQAFLLYYKVARSPAESNRRFAASTEPYDVWFKRGLGAVLGVDMNQPVTVAAELVYDSIPADAEPKHRTAMAMPLVDPAAWRELIAEINGPRRAEHDEFHRRLGVYDDRFQVAAPGGELAILHLNAPDLRAAIGAFVASEEPHDVWLKRQSLAATGIDWNRPPPGPLPELVFSWQAG